MKGGAVEAGYVINPPYATLFVTAVQDARAITLASPTEGSCEKYVIEQPPTIV